MTLADLLFWEALKVLFGLTVVALVLVAGLFAYGLVRLSDVFWAWRRRKQRDE